MDMFYNNPIRTFLVLFCLLFVSGSAFAQCDTYTLTSVVSVKYLGCVDADAPNTNPDLYISIDIAPRPGFLGYNGGTSLTDVASFIPGTTSTITTAQILPAIAPALPAGPFSAAPGSAAITAYAWDGGAGTPAPARIPVPLPTAAGVSNVVVVYPCYEVTYAINHIIAPIPQIANVKSCISAAPAAINPLDNLVAAGPVALAYPSMYITPVNIADATFLTAAGTAAVTIATADIASPMIVVPGGTPAGTYNFIANLSTAAVGTAANSGCETRVPFSVIVTDGTVTAVGSTTVSASCNSATTKVRVTVPTNAAPPTGFGPPLAWTAGVLISTAAGVDTYEFEITNASIPALPAAPTAFTVNSSVCPFGAGAVFNLTRGGNSTLSCNRYINLSLGAGCSATITPEMVLNVAPGAPNLAGYTIQLLEVNGNSIAAAGASATVPAVGSYRYEVTAPCGEKCWGEIEAKDKVAPTCVAPAVTDLALSCTTNETVVAPIPAPSGTTLPNDAEFIYFRSGGVQITAETAASATTRRNVTKTFGIGKIYEGAYTFGETNRTSIDVVYRKNTTETTLMTINDNCGIAQIGYTDNVQEGCDIAGPGTIKRITRTWYAVDKNGNRITLNCVNTITFSKPTGTIVLPGAVNYLATYTTLPAGITAGATGNYSMVLCSNPVAVREPNALGSTVTVAGTGFVATTGVPRLQLADGTYQDIPTSFSGACMISASKSDVFVPGCTAEVGKITRVWTVTDMCTKVSVQGTQIITVMAPRPVVTLNDEVKFCSNTSLPAIFKSDVQRLVSTDAGVCTSSATILNATVNSSANACATSVTDAFITITARTRNNTCDAYNTAMINLPYQLRGLDAKIPDLPAGVYTVSAYFVNNCGMRSDADGNTTGDQDHTFDLVIQDNEAPTAISIDRLSIGLTNAVNGLTRITAAQLDKGSSDNCGVASRSVAIVNADGTFGPFGPFVEVTCSMNPMVALKITDCAVKLDANDVNGDNVICEFRGDANANSNVVMVPLDIQDKSVPVCSAPGNMNMTCADWLQIKRLVGTGSVAAGSALSTDAATINLLQSMAGKFGGVSSCTPGAKESFTANVNACGEGAVVRTFSTTKTINGVTTTSTPCTQVIRFVNNKEQSFTATFPVDTNTESCDATPKVRPTVTGSDCENIQVTYSDEVFTDKNLDPYATAKTCKKIIRTWKVINMCIYNPTANNALPEGDADCVYDETMAIVKASNGLVAFKDTYNNSGWSSTQSGVTPSGRVVSGGYAEDRRLNCDGNGDRIENGAFTNWYNQGIYVDANTAAGADDRGTGNCDNIIVSGRFFDITCNPANPTPTVNAPFNARRGTIRWVTRGSDGRLTFRDRTGDGVIRYVQVINVNDTTTPVLYNCTKPETVTDVPAASYPADRFCEGVATLTKLANDVCSGNKVTLTLDIAVEDGTRLFTAADGSSVATKSVAATQSVSADGASALSTFTGALPLNKILVATWVATDECGNKAQCNDRFRVLDKKAPTVQCRDIYSSAMQMSAGQLMTSLNVGKFVLMGSDNCTSMRNMRFSYTNTGTFGAADTTKTWTCTEFKNSASLTVKIYAYDESGNFAVCEPNLFITPSDRALCTGAGAASVAGLIQNETSEGVEKVTVKLNADAGVTAFETAADGKFNYNLPIGKDYSVNPAKTTGLLNGVSTYDLVLIQKHILDVEKLNSSYKVVAADVNKDGKVTTLDIVELRKAILRISSTFPNGQNSWRFVHKDYAFASTEGAAGETFPETFNINNLKAQQKADFVGVKVGDVNESAAPNSLIGAEERGSRKAFVMTAEDRIVKAGEEVSMNVVADAANVAGFQYTLNFDKNALEFAGVKAGAINMTDANVAVVEGAITTSWNGEATNGNLFTVTFRAKTDGRLSELVNVNSRYTEAEAYTKQAETMNVELRFNGTAANGFALFQNQPNPFSKETIIGFNLPSAQAATLKVYDVTGKAIKMVNADYAKGYNEVKIADLKATGVLYYTLETQGFTATKKMVIVE
jgi:Dockerin type I domain/Cohesin domain